MYWLRVGKLAEDLREGRVTEKERFKYYLATFIAYGVAVQLFIYLGGPFDVDRLISAAVNLTAAVTGIFFCYRINRSGDDSDFIPRMICLGWPVGVWCVMLAGVCALFAASGGKLQELSIRFFAGQLLIFFIVPYYHTIRGHLALIARAKRGQSEHDIMMKSAMSFAEIAFGFLWAIGGLYILMYGMVNIPRVMGQNSLATLLPFLAVWLWALLFYSIFVWRRRRARKHATEKS